MKLINKDTDYAIRALDCIARKDNEVVSVSEIAPELGIPKPFLRKILQILQKEGKLKSYEGRNGGFTLAVPIDQIFLVDLIEIFQGPLKLTDCLFKKRICPDANCCLLKKKIEHIESLVADELKAVTIASVSSYQEHKT